VDYLDVLRVLLDHHADLGDDAGHVPKQGSKSTFYKVHSEMARVFAHDGRPSAGS
jgi:hypothetical protein